MTLRGLEALRQLDPFAAFPARDGDVVADRRQDSLEVEGLPRPLREIDGDGSVMKRPNLGADVVVADPNADCDVVLEIRVPPEHRVERERQVVERLDRPLVT